MKKDVILNEINEAINNFEKYEYFPNLFIHTKLNFKCNFYEVDLENLSKEDFIDILNKEKIIIIKNLFKIHKNTDLFKEYEKLINYKHFNNKVYRNLFIIYFDKENLEKFLLHKIFEYNIKKN